MGPPVHRRQVGERDHQVRVAELVSRGPGHLQADRGPLLDDIVVAFPSIAVSRHAVVSPQPSSAHATAPAEAMPARASAASTAVGRERERAYVGGCHGVMAGGGGPLAGLHWLLACGALRPAVSDSCHRICDAGRTCAMGLRVAGTVAARHHTGAGDFCATLATEAEREPGEGQQPETPTADSASQILHVRCHRRRQRSSAPAGGGQRVLKCSVDAVWPSRRHGWARKLSGEI